MRRIFAVLLSIALIVLCLAGCGQATASGTVYKIGLCNYVDDASLNQIVASIESRLEELGKENNVTFSVTTQNCNADSGVLSQIISNFTVDNVDLMIGVATPVAMQMQSATEDSNIPVVFAAVSDPVSAKLVDSLEKPGANITGTSDYLNTSAILNLMLVQNPNIKKVGLLYDVGQDSSTTPIAEAKAYLEGKGIEIVERTGTTVEEVTLAASALVTAGVEAVFTPTDNTIMKSQLAIYETFAEAGIPHYTGADSFALNGAFLGYGVNYEALGEKTAEMVADILLNGKNPGDVKVETFDNGIATINTEICTELGLDFDDLCDKFSGFCSMINTVTTANSFDDLNK